MKKLFLISTAVFGSTVAHGQIGVTLTGSGITCAGFCDGTATANPSGGSAPYTYMWSPTGQITNTITGLCAGTYTVIVSDANGATATGTITLTQPPVLSILISSTSASCSTCCDGSATGTQSGGTAPYTYLWSPGGQSTSNISGLCVGNYTLCVTDAQGCTSCMVYPITSPVNGINEIIPNNSISIFPNPFSTQTVLQMSAKRAIPQGGTDNLLHNATLTLYNSFGQEVKQFVIRNSPFVIERSNLPNGLYLLRLTEDNKIIATDKLVITD